MGIAVYLSDTCNKMCLIIHQNISKVKDSKEETLETLKEDSF